MDCAVLPQNEDIREIEDIIDIQKANGNFNNRQVAFKLPPEYETTRTANLAKSQESGLSKKKANNVKKKLKKININQKPRLLPDVVSWPSDSDITVLRMKLCLTGKDLPSNAGNAVPGDGLHQPDTSSMINLATLMRQSETPSKQSINIEEYLLPLTSWEPERNSQSEVKETKSEPKCPDNFNIYMGDYSIYEAMCSQSRKNKTYGSPNSQSEFSKHSTKSKVARFLRLYFCPCCTCLYELENIRDKPSAYFTK